MISILYSIVCAPLFLATVWQGTHNVDLTVAAFMLWVLCTPERKS